MRNTNESLGFIGVGLMGLPMILRLLRAGYRVTVWNRTAEKLQPVITAGAIEAVSIAELAAQSGVILPSLADTAAVATVVFGAGGILNGLDHFNLFMQYDIYHMRTMGEKFIDFFNRHADRIGHVQFADAPRRGQPGTGAINFGQRFDAIDRSGYRGWFGAEFRPTVGTSASLDWLSQYR